MEPSCVRQTSIPGTSKLFGDYLYDFDRVSQFYDSHFFDLEAFRHSAQTLNYPESRRAGLVAALREQNGESAALSKFAEPGTAAVVTGQQVGLFSGPAYTIYKALTAVKAAEHLSNNGIPAVPVFWLATEDHDLAEVDHAWVFDSEAIPQKIAVTNAITNGGPVGDVKLGPLPLAELREVLGELPFADAVLQRVTAAYRPGATLGVAFRSFLQDILKDLGLLFLDPLCPSVRQLAAPFLTSTVDHLPELISALRQRDSDLVAAGYHTQVYVDENTSLLFVLGDRKRIPIRWRDGRFITRDRSYSASELQALSSQISPSALLRPVMQDYLLPTVTYVGGPAEIAYMAQSEVLYQKLLGRMPVILPRNSFTLLDARATKLLDRYDMHVSELFEHHDSAKSRIAAKLVPADLSEEFASFRSATSASLGKLEAMLNRLDPTLKAAARKSASKIRYQVDKLARKTARETMQRDQRATRDATYLLNLVYPHRHLQERFYSIIPFLAKHGLDLPKRLLAQTQLLCPDHMVRSV